MSDLSDAIETPEPVQLMRLGIDYPLSEKDIQISFQAARIKHIENLNLTPQLQKLCLISNEIEKIENLEPVADTIEHLELYQNKIEVIENLSKLTHLKVLDLSFNRIRQIQDISQLVHLKQLYLSSNKISTIEGLSTLVNLELLELGSNRIRQIQGIENLKKLKELWLGKNKITQLTLPSLPDLERLSVQSNRLDSWGDTLFTSCPNLKELYLSHNMLPDVPDDIKNLANLCILDIGTNAVKNISAVSQLAGLEDLWVNGNKLEKIQDIKCLSKLENLQTLYVEGNPVQGNLGPGYRQAVLDEIPGLIQLDAILVGSKVNIVDRPLVGKVGVKPIMKHND